MNGCFKLFFSPLDFQIKDNSTRIEQEDLLISEWFDLSLRKVVLSSCYSSYISIIIILGSDFQNLSQCRPDSASVYIEADDYEHLWIVHHISHIFIALS